jgi:hypothetical protein
METTTEIKAKERAEQDKVGDNGRMSRQAVVTYGIISTCALIGAALYCYFTGYWDAGLMLSVPAIVVPLLAIRMYRSFK